MSRALFRKKTSFVNAAALGLFAFCFFLLAANCGKGLDITDRSFYLLWAEQPENVIGSITHFGFITGLMHDLLGRDIALFRLGGLSVLTGLGLVFACSLQRFLKAKLPEQLPGPIFTASLTIAVLCGCLFYYHRWLHAPSYNWLALAATLLAVSSVLRFTAGGKMLFNVPALALGGMLAFAAKPTTALALGVLSAVFVFAHRPNRNGMAFILLSGFLCTIFLAGFGIVFFGSPASYARNLKLGLELSSALGGGHDLGSLLLRSGRQIVDFLSWWGQSPPVLVYCGILAAYAAIKICRPKSKGIKWLKKIQPFLLLLFFAYAGYRFQSGESGFYLSTALNSLLGLLVLTAAASLAGPREKDEAPRLLLISGLALTAFLIGAALAPPFGTSSGVVRRMSQYSVFLSAGACILFYLTSPSGMRESAAAFFTLGLGILLTLTLVRAYEHPYRLLQGISGQEVEIRLAGGRLRVDGETADYVRRLREIANSAGWRTRTPLIDMTGGSPGACLILDAEIPGTPWLLGNYPGSDEFASRILARLSRDMLHRAWILTAPNGERSLGKKVLLNNGLNFPKDYVRTGAVTTGHRLEKQYLWKPEPHVMQE